MSGKSAFPENSSLHWPLEKAQALRQLLLYLHLPDFSDKRHSFILFIHLFTLVSTAHLKGAFIQWWIKVRYERRQWLHSSPNTIQVIKSGSVIWARRVWHKWVNHTGYTGETWKSRCFRKSRRKRKENIFMNEIPFFIQQKESIT